MSLHVGTSGWAYREWSPAFYPPGLPASAYLRHYAGELTACEVNATFYRLQSTAAVARWADETPAGFRFAAKAHRALTHGRALPSPDDEGDLLERFVDSLAPLEDRLGAVLFQLPPSRRRDDDALEGFLRRIPAGVPFAVEFRHASWETPEVAERVAEAGGTVCLAETAGSVPERLPPGPLAYVRLRGESYPEEARSAWARLLRAEAARRPVLAFAKHEGVAPDDPSSGLALARDLARETA